MIERTRSLSLTGLEVVWLSDAVRNAKTIKEHEDEPSCVEPLVLNLGSAYLELCTSEGIAEGPVEIAVTEAQCWLMRALVRTGDLAIDGKTNVGVPLLTKLYGLLMQFASELDDLEVGAYDGAVLSEDAKRDLKERSYDTRWRPNENTYPGAGP